MDGKRTLSVYVNASCKKMPPVRIMTPTTVDPASNAPHVATVLSLEMRRGFCGGGNVASCLGVLEEKARLPRAGRSA